jgi:hypothetical protein
MAWDVMRGFWAIGKESSEELARVLGERDPGSVSPADALVLAREFSEDVLLLYANAHRFWNEPSVMQGIWNLRDTFKANGRMLVLLASLGSTLPAELMQDVFIDEIEKAFAGTGTDLSGVKTEMAGTMLTWMQDHEAEGLILLGPPGSAKSATAKATRNSAGIPTIAFDLTAMESSLVGASGDRLRTALKVVEAVSQGRGCKRRIGLSSDSRTLLTA